MEVLNESTKKSSFRVCQRMLCIVRQFKNALPDYKPPFHNPLIQSTRYPDGRLVIHKIQNQ